jgi:hypothetical protein
MMPRPRNRKPPEHFRLGAGYVNVKLQKSARLVASVSWILGTTARNSTYLISHNRREKWFEFWENCKINGPLWAVYPPIDEWAHALFWLPHRQVSIGCPGQRLTFRFVAEQCLARALSDELEGMDMSQGYITRTGILSEEDIRRIVADPSHDLKKVRFRRLAGEIIKLSTWRERSR